MSEARFAILDTIRRQLGADADVREMVQEDAAVGYARIPRTYQRTTTLDHEAVLELFYDRLRDYDSELMFTDEAGIPAAVDNAMAAAGEKLLLVPVGVPDAWLPHQVEVRRDEDLPLQPLEEPRVVLSGCTVGIAMSGTIVLEHGAEQGRRAATLLADHHICVIHRSQVVETISEALARMQYRAGPITTIAGPSATSDIEMTRIRGVHGPRRLTAVIL